MSRRPICSVLVLGILAQFILLLGLASADEAFRPGDEDSLVLLSSKELCKNFREPPLIRFSIEQNDGMNDRNSGIRKVGPFLLGDENKHKNNWQHEELNLVMEPIKCEDECGQVSIMMWVVPESMDRETAVLRTGISEATMTAEGTWDQSKGELHMVGCIGGTHTDLVKRCNSRIVLHFPRTFSLTQRSVITGSISSIGDQNESLSPLRISLVVRPRDLGNYYWYSTPCEYNYSMIELAREFLERSRCNQPPNFISSIVKAIMRYPSFEGRGLGGGRLFSRLSRLSEKLHFRTGSFPIQLNNYDEAVYYLQADILSVGPLCGRYSPQKYDYTLAEVIAARQTEKSGGSPRFVNVSVHLTCTVDNNVFTGQVLKSVTYLFLEGLYDTYSGEMTLVGCGNIEFGRSFSIIGAYLDCLMAVRIQYSPPNTRWLRNPSVKITIMSQRNDSDPLYFHPFTLRKISVYSPTHQQDVVFRVTFEGLLRVLLLILDIGVILGQFFYMKKHPEVVSRISLVMLGVQILGYLFPLISNVGILIQSKESNSYAKTRPYGDLGQYSPLIKILDVSAKVLQLIALLLISRLFQKIARSRTGARLGGLEELNIVVPDDRKVLFKTIAVHMLGFALMISGPEVRLDAEYYLSLPWKKLIVLYFKIVETLFMLPQIIMNSLWMNSGVQPVRRAYLIAFFLSRLLLSSYDRLRDPILDPDSPYDWGYGYKPDMVLPCGRISLGLVIILLSRTMIILGPLE